MASASVHVNETTLKKLAKDNFTHGKNFPSTSSFDLPFCEGCAEGKMTRKTFDSVGEIRSKRKLELIHSDVCTIESPSIGGSKYFVTFIDDYSRCCAVYFLRQKSDVLGKFKEFATQTATNAGHSISILRSDRGGEYLTNEFMEYLKANGIRHELTASYTPQQNGVAERMNRTLCEAARCMLHHANLSKKYWAEAVATAAYVRNRLPTASHKNNVTPYEKWYGRKPTLDHMRVFGCAAYAHVLAQLRRKLDKKCQKLRFVGYSIQSKAYRLYDESTGKIVIKT